MAAAREPNADGLAAFKAVWGRVTTLVESQPITDPHITVVTVSRRTAVAP
jgi:hypothetical protein